MLSFDPGEIDITATADSLNLPGPYTVAIGVSGASQLAFTYVGPTNLVHNGINNGEPNFVVVSPSAGTVPAPAGNVPGYPQATAVWIALNPAVVPYMPSGSYALNPDFTWPGEPSGLHAAIVVTLNLNSAPPAIQSVVNAATLQPAISPGEIVSIFGAHLGTAPVTGQPNGAGVYPTDLSHQNTPYPPNYGLPPDGVTFNGTAAPLLYYSSSQINAIVPYEVAGQSSVNVVVTHNGTQTSAFALPLSATSPGIFTVSQNGSGEGAILNADGTPNSAANPAAQGSAISLFVTGTGVLQQSVPDGSVLFGGGENCPNSQSSTSCKPPTDSQNALFPAAALSVTIGGQPALLQYVGPSPGSAAALAQINALVPTGIGSGPQPVVLTAGQNNNAQQHVTVAVQ